MHIFFCFFISLLIIANLSHAKEYHFVGIEGLIDQKVGKIFLTEVYSQLDVPIDIQLVPAKRAEHETVSGMRDGEIMRIFNYGVQHPNLIRVPTPYYRVVTKAFINQNSGIVINHPKDILQYHIAKVRGVAHTERVTVGARMVHNLNDTKALIAFIHLGRADIGLTNEIDGLYEIRKQGFTNVLPVTKPLATLELYHYIHENHKNLVPKVDAILKKMRVSGEMKKLLKIAETSVMPM